MASSFSWEPGINDFTVHRSASPRLCLRVNRIPDLPGTPPYTQQPRQPSLGSFSLLRPHITTYKKFRNINLIPIDYALQPRLRGRLTLLRLTSCRKPGTSGVRVFHPHYRYSCQHSHFRYLQDASRLSLHQLTERSATARHSLECPTQSFGSWLEPRYIFGAETLV